MHLSLRDLSSIRYQRNSHGTISYSDIGRGAYGEIFWQVGIDIDDVCTVEQHRVAVALAVET